MTDNTTPERVERWTIRLHPDCGYGRTHEGTLLDVEIEAIPVTPLLRWLDERVKATRVTNQERSRASAEERGDEVVLRDKLRAALDQGGSDE